MFLLKHMIGQMRRGWRPNLDKKVMDPSAISRRNYTVHSAMAPSADGTTISEAKGFGGREEDLSDPRGGVRLPDVMLHHPADRSEMHTEYDVLDMNSQNRNESLFELPELQERLDEIHDTQRRERKQRRSARVAQQAQEYHNAQNKFLRLHNAIHGPNMEMSPDQVQLIFARPSKIKTAIKELELERKRRLAELASDQGVSIEHHPEVTPG